jgi:peptidoglycan/xylan/chitin deacetylase (PgdA/CDA1 family)
MTDLKRNKSVRQSLLIAGWRLPLIRVLSHRQLVILLYHGIPPESDGNCIDGTVFEQHVTFLKRHFEFVSPQQIGKSRKSLDKIRILLTFDDGFRNNAEVVAPILRRHNVPGVFFVCSRHTKPGKYLWFSYLRALQKHFRGNGFHFRGEFINMSGERRRSNVERLWDRLLALTPHPEAMYQAIEEELPQLEDFISQEELARSYAGMTGEQMGELASDPLFSIGAHTVDHPFLTKCDNDEALRQILQNKNWIEKLSNKRCTMIAYPSGDYDSYALNESLNLGFTHGHAVIPILRINPQLEIPRIGIYSKSLDVLGFKVQWGNFMRAVRVKVG